MLNQNKNYKKTLTDDKLHRGEDRMNLQKLFFTKNECYQKNQKIKVIDLLLHSTGANNPKLSRYVGPDDGKLGVNKYNNHWNVYHPGGKDIGPHTYQRTSSTSSKCKVCGGKQICCHGFIGKLADGTIATYQTLPWEINGWQCGGDANGYTIGIEICEDNLTDKTYFNAVYKEATELFAYLADMFDIDPINHIMSHKEAAKKGLASNHGDPEHWFSKHGKTMDMFRQDVKALMTKKSETPKEDTVEALYDSIDVGDILSFTGDRQYTSSTGDAYKTAKPGKVKVTKKTKETAKHPIHVRSVDDKGNFIPGIQGWIDLKDLRLIATSFRVKVVVNSLMYRSGPSIYYPIQGTITDKGVYTIVQTKGVWGQLKSKVGWINLNYTERI